MEESRTKNSIRNISFSLIYYFVQIVLTFFVRMLFVRVFAGEYLGINALYSNIIGILSVVESGFGSAIIFALYKPVAENNEEKVRQLIQLYKKYYTIIGVIITLIGFAIIPFLPYLIKDFYSIDLNLYVMFVIFLMSSVLSYFTAHRRALFYTTQRSDIETKIAILSYFTTVAVQLLSILVFKNYYVYALAGLINVILISVLIVLITNKKYKRFLLAPENKIPKEESKKITQNVFALFYHKVGGIVLTATDSIILSAFIGSVIVGKYANYLLITTSLNTLMAIFIGSMKGSIGNLIATESIEKNYELFNRFNKIFMLINTFVCICFICLANPFISTFFGSDMVLPLDSVVVIGVSMYVLNLRQIVYSFKECKGLFKENKYAPLIESLINLTISIILVKYLGLTGVILGTIISCVLVPLWNEPYILNKHYFRKSNTKYMMKLSFYIMMAFIVGSLTMFICSFIPSGGIWLLIAKFAVCIPLCGGLLLLCYAPIKEFRKCFKWGVELIKKSIYRFKHKANDNK